MENMDGSASVDFCLITARSILLWKLKREISTSHALHVLLGLEKVLIYDTQD
jgi:hypothetical protein